MNPRRRLPIEHQAKLTLRVERDDRGLERHRLRRRWGRLELQVAEPDRPLTAAPAVTTTSIVDVFKLMVSAGATRTRSAVSSSTASSSREERRSRDGVPPDVIAANELEFEILGRCLAAHAEANW